MMTHYLLKEWPERHDWDIKVVFANTGKEDPGTLDFLDECQTAWGIDVVWVEGYPSSKGKGWGVDHKIVTYETASRNGEPFEAMISRIGIPSSSAPFCSDQLKRKAIESYLKSIGWKGYWKALGIRVDEPKRINKKWKSRRILYPFAHIEPTTKSQVLAWWDKQDFNLDIHPDLGNCNCCWKKAFSVLYRIAQKTPKEFDWWQEMTEKYGSMSARDINSESTLNFYRGGKSPTGLIEEANKNPLQAGIFDRDLICGESCEPFK